MYITKAQRTSYAVVPAEGKPNSPFLPACLQGSFTLHTVAARTRHPSPYLSPALVDAITSRPKYHTHSPYKALTNFKPPFPLAHKSYA